MFYQTEMQSSVINESDYLLKKSTDLPKYHTLSILSEIVTEDITPSDDREDRHKQPDKDSMASLRTIHSNLSPVGQSTKLPGHTTATPCK